jgi:hypothetical protein
MTHSLDGLDIHALRRYFAEVVPHAGPIDAELVRGGRSNLTY